MKLILVRGTPGSGKTTFCLKQFKHIFHIENDMFHMKDCKYMYDVKQQKKAVAWCKNMCIQALEQGMDCIVSNTFVLKSYINEYKKIAEQYGAEFIVYRLCGHFENDHNVPIFVLNNMKNNFEDYDGEINVHINLNDNSFHISENNE